MPVSVSLFRKICSSVLGTIIVLLLLNSCQKTVTDILDDDPPPVALDKQCKVNKLEFRFDGANEWIAYNFKMDTEGNPLSYSETGSDGSVLDYKTVFSPGRMDFMDTQWVEFDDSGRIAKSRSAYTIWDASLTNGRLLSTYEYDAAGYLIKIIEKTEPHPNVWPGGYDRDVTNTWLNGNLIKSESDTAYQSYQYMEMTYDLTKPGSDFMSPNLNSPVSTFHHFVNPGRKSKNLLTKIHFRWTDYGVIYQEYTYDFSNFTFDEKGNVTSFKFIYVMDSEPQTGVCNLTWQCF